MKAKGKERSPALELIAVRKKKSISSALSDRTFLLLTA